jgi:hypothetical protein
MVLVECPCYDDEQRLYHIHRLLGNILVQGWQTFLRAHAQIVSNVLEKFFHVPIFPDVVLDRKKRYEN